MGLQKSAQELLTKRDVAKTCNVCLRTVDSWIARRAIACVKIGGSVRFLRSDLDAFIQTNRIGKPVQNGSSA
jgi:excisionase family DNA binding protein